MTLNNIFLTWTDWCQGSLLHRCCIKCITLPCCLVSSLQTLLLDGNFLNCLPTELHSLQGLTYLGLSFNCFSGVPPVLEKLKGVERLCLAGNRLSVLDVDRLQWLPARHIDLRYTNCRFRHSAEIQENLGHFCTMSPNILSLFCNPNQHLELILCQQRKKIFCILRLNQLQKVTITDSEQLVHILQMDLRDTGLQELDIQSLCSLELLRCDRNALSLLRVSGYALKSLHAAHNGTITLLMCS